VALLRIFRSYASGNKDLKHEINFIVIAPMQFILQDDYSLRLQVHLYNVQMDFCIMTYTSPSGPARASPYLFAYKTKARVKLQA
jgi:hypothetical protein